MPIRANLHLKIPTASSRAVRLCALLAVGTFLAMGAASRAVADTDNLVTNGDAESGTMDNWEGGTAGRTLGRPSCEDLWAQL
jgi:hypothetical protein